MLWEVVSRLLITSSSIAADGSSCSVSSWSGTCTVIVVLNVENKNVLGQVAHGLLLIWVCYSFPLLLLWPIAHVFLLIILLLSIVVCCRNDAFILMLLVHHFELWDGFLGLVETLLAEVTLPVDPPFLSIVLSFTPHIVWSHELLHDFIVFLLLMCTSLWMHLLEIVSVLIESGLSVASFIKWLPLLCHFLQR